MAKRLGQHQAPSSAWITRERRLAIYIRDGFTCLACHEDLRFAKPADVTLDHLISKSEYAALDEQTRQEFGSVHASHNIVTTCRSCNSRRRDTAWTEFYSVAGQARVLAARERMVNLELAKAILRGEIGDPRTEAVRA
jgi:5-methylcytosine-specific restriction endonuclease McrA